MPPSASGAVAIHLRGLPGDCPSRGGRAARVPRLALLRVGFAEPTGSPRSLVRSYRTVSPLPVRARPVIGGLFSVALSCGSPRLAASQHPALRSPDLPRPGPARGPDRGHPAGSPSPPVCQVDGLLRFDEAADERLVVLDRQGVVVRVEGALVVFLAELLREVEVLVAAVALSDVAVLTEEMAEVVALEGAVVLDHPMQVVGKMRAQHRGSQLGVIGRGQVVADVVEERGQHIEVVAPGSLGPGGGLKAVGQPVHGEPTRIVAQPTELLEHRLAQRHGRRGRADDGPVLGGAFAHRSEGRPLRLFGQAGHGVSVSLWPNCTTPKHQTGRVAPRPVGGEVSEPGRPRMTDRPSVILSLSCSDQVGIVHSVTGWLAERGLNIVESKQFGDHDSARFFLRIQAEPMGPTEPIDALRAAFEPLAERFAMTWELHDAGRRPVLLLMVSKLGHCLNDLLYRHQTGALAVEIPAVVSNHPDLAGLADMYGVPFHHWPVEPETKQDQEAAVLRLVDELEVDLVVLARYMQILTPLMVDRLPSRIINIHHGLLPGFEGASPHRQAYDAGVKVIGATAHYVTSTLDHGPIIEQVTAPVDHAAGPGRIQSMTRDLECLALAHAVQWHVEHRVLSNGNKTVVFA